MATPILKDYANGVRDVKSGKFYPFLTTSFSGAGTAVERANNRRFYIHTVTVNLAALAADAGVSVRVTGKKDLADMPLAEILHTTLTAQERTATFHPGLLLDPEAPVTVTAADLTGVLTWVQYAEVDIEAEYRPVNILTGEHNGE